MGSRRIWIAASGLADSAKTPPGYDRITIFAQAAQATDIEQAKLQYLPLCLFRDEALRCPSTRLKSLLKYWDGSRVEAEGRMARSEGGTSPQWAVTTERRGQLPFCLAPSTVALILAFAFVARLAEIALDIGAALRALANTKIHSNAAHPNTSTAS